MRMKPAVRLRGSSSSLSATAAINASVSVEPAFCNAATTAAAAEKPAICEVAIAQKGPTIDSAQTSPSPMPPMTITGDLPYPAMISAPAPKKAGIAVCQRRSLGIQTHQRHLSVGMGAVMAESEQAVRLANDPETPAMLARLRTGMREQLRASAACDADGLCQAMEAFYRQIVV